MRFVLAFGAIDDRIGLGGLVVLVADMAPTARRGVGYGTFTVLTQALAVVLFVPLLRHAPPRCRKP
ncbi:MAG: hypothetical protein ACRDQX_14600 [Pseudonocardiaceae bacterium]